MLGHQARAEAQTKNQKPKIISRGAWMTAMHTLSRSLRVGFLNGYLLRDDDVPFYDRQAELFDAYSNFCTSRALVLFHLFQ